MGNELSLILEEKQSKYRYMFRNTLLSPSGDCCNVSDTLIDYLQVALMQNLTIYDSSKDVESDKSDKTYFLYIKAMQLDACHILWYKWHQRTKRDKYFHLIHDLTKHFSPKSWCSCRWPAQALKWKKLTWPIFLLTWPIFLDVIPLALNTNGMP